uniref:Uncharacterized protein n=1 Tax=Arundo donax TaxID=35708 RepID=A0A0A9CRL0_ARUDO
MTTTLVRWHHRRLWSLRTLKMKMKTIAITVSQRILKGSITQIAAHQEVPTTIVEFMWSP